MVTTATWLAKVGCEGGPLRVCDVSAFAASVLTVPVLVLALTGCSSDDASPPAGTSTGGATGAATAAAATTAAGPAAQAARFDGSTLDKGVCAVVTAADTTALQMSVKGPATAGQNQVAADQPVVYYCRWAYNDEVRFAAYPSAEVTKRIMSQTRRGEEIVTDLVPGADEAYYRGGTGDQVKAILTVRAGKLSLGVSLNETVAKLSPADAKNAAIGLATLALARCPNVR